MAPVRTSRVQLTWGTDTVRIAFSPIWLVVLPLMVYGVRVLYVPLLGAALSSRDAWLAALTIVGGTLLGLIAHCLAHAGVARALHAVLPPELPLYPLGDAAQVWPSCNGVATEALVSSAGPLASLIVAGIAFAIWNAQFDTFANTVTLFLIVMNTGIALINLAPAFPFDGGRLLRALVQQRLHAVAPGTKLAHRFGLLLLLWLIAWAAFLAWQRLRFSAETSASTLIVTALIALAFFFPPVWRAGRPDGRPPQPALLLLANFALIAVTAVAMAAGIALVLPLNAGLEAPGSAVPVGPMVQAPPDHTHRHAGTLMLTTVIPQAPIVVAEWLYAHADPAIRLTTPQAIVPSGISPQEESIQGLHDLQTSEQTAIVVGLHLAGYPASVTHSGAEIAGILPDSKANGVLKAGDTITAVNGSPVREPSDVAKILATAPAAKTAVIEFKRGNRLQSRRVALIAPAAGSAIPRIGIDLAATTGRLDTPFPVTITPREVVGGPSAGLMFSLAVANALSVADLTRGYRIAGTGTIDLSGAVGAIGGVQQKVAAAEQAGARYFLCPVDNYAQARAVAKHITVVRVATAEQALAFLRTLPPAR